MSNTITSVYSLQISSSTVMFYRDDRSAAQRIQLLCSAESQEGQVLCDGFKENTQKAKQHCKTNRPIVGSRDW